MGRTRLVGVELVQALMRIDEVLESHDSNKGNEWPQQPWKKHIGKAIAHLANALVNQEDGSEIEASHGACRAIMGLQLILQDQKIEHKLCQSHAIPAGQGKPGKPYTVGRGELAAPVRLDHSACHAHAMEDCKFCGRGPRNFCWRHGASSCRACWM